LRVDFLDTACTPNIHFQNARFRTPNRDRLAAGVGFFAIRAVPADGLKIHLTISPETI
jgi:hypothetical protein